MRPEALDGAIFEQITGARGTDLASVLIPTHRRGRSVEQDRIRLKNSLAAIDGELEARGLKPRERATRLDEATALLDDREFWEHQADGLGVFIGDDGSVRGVAIDGHAASLAAVMPVFHVRHLVGTVMRTPVPVLALTKSEVALFEVVGETAEQVDAEFPSFEDTNWFTDREVQRQQHPSGSAPGTHGHDPDEDREHDTERFLRAVDAAIPGTVGSGLIVLGDDSLVSGFAKISGRSIDSPPNSGISASISPDKVAALAAPLIGEREARRVADALESAAGAVGRGEGAVEISEAIQLAGSGRVGDLVLDATADPVWGSFDPATFVVEVHDERRQDDVDLLDRLVALTLENGGKVSVVDGPVSSGDFVAIARF